MEMYTIENHGAIISKDIDNRSTIQTSSAVNPGIVTITSGGVLHDYLPIDQALEQIQIHLGYRVNFTCPETWRDQSI